MNTNLTKSCNNRWNYLLLFILMTFSCYALLVVANFVISQAVYQYSRPPEAVALENRRASHDVVEQQELHRLGFIRPYLPIHGDSLTISRFKAYLPVASQPNSAIYLCNEGYGMIETRTDRYGFRNNDDIWNEQVDVAVIGDSFVHGSCVDDASTISGVLNAKGLSTLNLGLGGNQPFGYMAAITTIVPIALPKHLVLVFYANDYEILPKQTYFRELIEAALLSPDDFPEQYVRQYLTPNSALRIFFKQIEAIYTADSENVEDAAAMVGGNLNRFLDRAIPHLKLDIFRTLLMRQTGELPETTRLTIEIAEKVCKKNACNVHVLYIPSSDFWRPNAISDLYAAQIEEYVSQNRSIEYIDVSNDYVDPSNRSDYAPAGGHLSIDGYRKVAELIHKNLTNE